MGLEHINLNHLKIFKAVYLHHSMTRAAKEMDLTQGGVSQAIKHLEEALGVKLFDRIKQKIIPTPEAQQLLILTENYAESLEEGILLLKGKNQTIHGKINIGIPLEFGNNLVVPLLSEFGQKYPRIHFDISYGFAADFESDLLKGKMDLAIVDRFSLDSIIQTQAIYSEIFCLAAHSDLVATLKLNKMKRKDFESLPYVEYVPGEPYLGRWFQHHFGWDKMDLNVRATLMNVRGIARFIQSGLGVGILPYHRARRMQDIMILPGSDTPLRNDISLAWVKQRSLSKPVVALKNFLVASLNVSSVD